MLKFFKRRKRIAKIENVQGKLESCSRPVIESLEGRQLFSIPAAPFALAGAAKSDTQVYLAWHDNSWDETGFRIDRQTAGGWYQTIATLAAGTTGYSDYGLTGSTQYNYRVYAFNASGNSSYSNNALVTTNASPVASSGGGGAWWALPNGPFGISATSPSSSQVNLRWYDNANNEIGFKVERSSNGGASFSTVAIIPVNTTAWSDAGLAAGTLYVYRVKAYNNAGDSSYSDNGWVTTGGSGTVASAVSLPSTGAPGFFPTAVFYQPANSFDKWKARGINTLYGYDGSGGVQIPQWDVAALQHGMQVIRQASSNPWADNSVSNLAAWLTPTDEPDMRNVSAATLNQQYWQLKGVNPNKPITTTYSGGYVLGWQGNKTAADYQSYMQSTDWVGADLYPVTGWNLPRQLGAVGKLVDTLQADGPGKKQFAFIESSNQNLAWVPNDRGATPDEMRAEIWDSVIHGANGIVYFPQQIGGTFSYDATPWNVAAEMTTQNARLQQYAGALNSQENPGNIGMSTGGALEVTWRSYGGKNYFFVLNLSNQWLTQTSYVRGVNPWAIAAVGGENRTVAVQNTAITDTFKPYEMHVYVI